MHFEYVTPVLWTPLFLTRSQLLILLAFFCTGSHFILAAFIICIDIVFSTLTMICKGVAFCLFFLTFSSLSFLIYKWRFLSSLRSLQLFYLQVFFCAFICFLFQTFMLCILWFHIYWSLHSPEIIFISKFFPLSHAFFKFADSLFCHLKPNAENINQSFNFHYFLFPPLHSLFIVFNFFIDALFGATLLLFLLISY